MTDVVHAETQLRKLEARRRALGDVLSPDLARRKVVDDAVTAVRAGGEFPSDIGKRAADAYRDALEGESEALALRTAADSLRYHLEYLKTTDGAELALEALGKRLADFLADVKRAAVDLKDARSAERAIEVGGKAPEAWRLLTSMLGTFRNIRAAQFDILKPLGEGQRLQNLREAGHFEVAGLQRDGVPGDILRAMTSGHYDVAYVIYIANLGTAWIPRSFDELEAEDVVDVGVPDDSVIDYTPRVTHVPEPSAPKRTGFERTPDIRLK
ncbi:hypothetical protein OG883_35695 [Streptomyces sp. NBC_01142]|uniref:hypothetical protein n=1 Tax=Streptomyces sp. NBC_01142 TaxID=2975865 RepID=UPI00224F5DD4|nr:hypothetical protein [Streptomyces sp. NBC_01142]MCX4825115.1 hypothetical protein [Streptomyces sp. NBC_01142]